MTLDLDLDRSCPTNQEWTQMTREERLERAVCLLVTASEHRNVEVPYRTLAEHQACHIGRRALMEEDA